MMADDRARWRLAAIIGRLTAMAERRDAREARLRIALRENLKRRKQQMRGRADHAGAAGGHDPASDQDQAPSDPQAGKGRD